VHPTPISAAVFFLASGGSGYLLSSRIGLPKDKVIRALAGLVLWEAIQVIPVQLLATAQILGWITRVTVPALAGVQSAVFACVAIWCLARRESATLPAGTDSHHDEPLPAYIFVAAAVLLASYLAFAANVFTSFPSGSDAVIYHLPLALRWLQDGSLAIPVSRAWRYCMPGNAEIGMMILLSSGRQSTVVMASCIPAIMLTLSTYLFARWISKGNRLASIMSSLIVLSIPMIAWQIFSAYVDLLGTAGIVAAFALVLNVKYREASDNSAELTAPVCFVAALACGISVGTKPIYYLFAVVFCVFMADRFWENRSRGAGALLKLAMLVGCGMLLPSSFWFARALKQTGNPVYPLQVKAGQRVLFAGIPASHLGDYRDLEFSFVRQRREWLVYPWTEWRRSPSYLKVTYSEGGGVGAVFATFVPLGVFFFFLRCGGRNPELRRDSILLLFFTGLVASWWTLMERVPRYGESILVFACVLSAPLIATLHSYARRALAVLVIGSTIATSVICASAPSHMLAGRLRKHLWSRAQIYGYPQLIDELPPGSVVLNASGISEKNFQMAGERLTNRVIADFEAPPELNVNSLRASTADYVVEVVPGGKYPTASLANSGATVIDDELIPMGEDKIRWRIWKVGGKNNNLAY
jgi:hypothetical protein